MPIILSDHQRALIHRALVAELTALRDRALANDVSPAAIDSVFRQRAESLRRAAADPLSDGPDRSAWW